MVKKSQIKGRNSETIKPHMNQKNQNKMVSILQRNMYEQKKIARIMRNIYIEEKLAGILRNIYKQKKLLLTNLENRGQISFRDKIYLELLKSKTKIDLLNDVNYIKTLNPIQREIFFIKQYEELYIIRQKINRMRMQMSKPKNMIMYQQRMFYLTPMRMMRPRIRREGDANTFFAPKSSTRISK